MKLITWNAAMRFREKIERVLLFMADILIIPECEAPEKWKGSRHLESISQFLWFGDNLNKGIGVISLTEQYQIQLHPSYNKEFRYVIPLIVTGEESFILFAVWAQHTKKQFDSYIGQIYLALNYHETLLKDSCIIIGDWNSNKIFDHIKRAGTHSDVVTLLKELGIASTYHHYFAEEHGEESIPTLYFRKEKARPFHIDFVFASINILERLDHLEIGSYEHWISVSDHVPIISVFRPLEPAN